MVAPPPPSMCYSVRVFRTEEDWVEFLVTAKGTTFDPDEIFRGYLSPFLGRIWWPFRRTVQEAAHLALERAYHLNLVEEKKDALRAEAMKYLPPEEP